MKTLKQIFIVMMLLFVYGNMEAQEYNYVRVTDLSEITEGSKIVIAARYNENANEYYALPTTIQNNIPGVAFTSTTASEGETLPSAITDSISKYVLTVSVDGDNYSFTNEAGQKFGYKNGSNLGADVNPYWTVTRNTAGEGMLVPNYEGFNIINTSTGNRAISLSGWTFAFGAYFTNYMSGGNYNFSVDIFVMKEKEADAAPAANYVRVTDLSEITAGSKIVIASRYNENANEYYALPTTIQNNIPGVAFTSTTASEGETLPSAITDSISKYVLTVSVDGDNYSFTNEAGQKFGYKNGSNLGADVNPYWTVTRNTAGEGMLVPNYEGFNIINTSTGNRAISLSGWTFAFGAYFTNYMSGGNYNFSVDIFVLKENNAAPAAQYLRIADVSDLKSGSNIVIAARYNENANEYYALPTAIQNNIPGVAFTSTTVSEGETLPSAITDSISKYALTVSIDGDNYSFTNAEGQKFGYKNGSNFGADVNPYWTVTRNTAGEGMLVPNYEGFNIINTSTGNRAISLSGWTFAFGAYFTNYMSGGNYNFSVDIFMLTGGEESTTVETPTFEPEAGTYISSANVSIKSKTGGANIYYTTDGSEPTETSQLYSVPFELTSTATVKAFASKNGVNSEIAEAAYTIIPKMSVAEARNANANTVVAVEGVVTYIDGRNVLLQDNTAAISLCLNEGTVPSNLKVGDKAVVYGTKNTNNGLAELTNIDGATSQFEIISSNNDLPLAEVTVEQILNDYNSGNLLQSTRIKITAAQIGDVNIGGNSSITQNGSSINIDNLPAVVNIEKDDYVTLTGFVGCNNAPQIRIASSDDIKPSDVLSIDKSSLELAYDEATFPVPQALNVEGSLLNENISVVAPDNFQVCDVVDGIYLNSITLTAVDGSVNRTVYVRLMPYLSEGEYTGVLTVGNSKITCEANLKGTAVQIEDNNFFGDGSESNPIRIYTKSDLQRVSNLIAGGWDSKGKYFTLMDDIYDVDFMIGNYDERISFKGVFDGNNHVIGLNLSGASNVALFSFVSGGAVIKNLITEGSVNVTSIYGAGIVARVDTSEEGNNNEHIYIQNCINRANVSASGLGKYLAGIVAHYQGKYNRGNCLFIEDCTNVGNINLTSAGYGAGILTYGTCGATINNCTNRGEINIPGSGGNMAGIAANLYNYCTVVNCVNVGNINGGSMNIGGIVGRAEKVNIYNSYNTGDINPNSWGMFMNVAGIVGAFSDYENNSTWGEFGIMKNVYNAGTINSTNGGLGSVVSSGNAKIFNAYYLEGTYSSALGSFSSANATNVVSFSQSATEPTSWILSSEVDGTTDLLTALNNGSDGNKEWFEDVYNVNDNLPTFVSAAPSIEVKALDMTFRPIGAKMYPEVMKITNTGFSPVELYHSDYSGSEFIKLAEDVEFPVVIEPNSSYNVYFTTDHTMEMEEGGVEATFGVFWNAQRIISTGKITAVAYQPKELDVVEKAATISEFPFRKTQSTAGLYKNYNLPGAGAYGVDAVYKFTVEEDILLNVNITGCSNPNVAVYPESVMNDGYPSDNNYHRPSSVISTDEFVIPYGGDKIRALTLTPGTYYMIVSTTSSMYEIDAWTESIPAPATASLISPEYGEKNVTAPVTLSWMLGNYTTEYQLLFGTTVPPTEILVDWTSDLNNTYVVESLYDNANYFWQINERNHNGVTEGDVWAFTTSLATPKNLAIESNELYPNQKAVLTWDAPVNRYTRGYNIYQDGVKINSELVTETTFSVSNLAYNQNGYNFNVTAMHDAGESALSNTVKAYMTGYGIVEGYTYEQDGTTPISDVLVVFKGTDEYGNEAERVFYSDNNGHFSGEILVGTYNGITFCDGYQNKEVTNVNIGCGMTSTVNFIIKEEFASVYQVLAEESNDYSNVNVAWSWNKIIPESPYADFETGDFSQAKFNNEVTAQHPWAITENAYEGTYAMKSSCEGVADGISSIEVNVSVPYDGVVAFYHKVSSEEGGDFAKFFVDGVEMLSISGETEWEEVIVPVTEGVHTYRWTYTKNAEGDNADDAYYVDNVMMFKPTPAYEGWIYYDNGTYTNSIGTNQVAPVYWGIRFPDTEIYEGSTLTKVAFYDAAAADYTANIYIGAMPSTATLVSSQPFTTMGITDIFEVELSTPVAIIPGQPLWITLYCDDLTHPAAACSHTGSTDSDWISLNGTTWNHVTEYNLQNSWILRGYLQDMDGKVRMISNEEEPIAFEGGSSEGDIVALEAETPKFVGVPSNEMASYNRSFSSYKVYRYNEISGECSSETVQVLVSETMDTTYVDNEWTSLEYGVYRYGVSAIYEGNRNAEQLRGTKAYANVIYPIGMPNAYVTFDLNNPLAATEISPVVFDRGGDYYDGILYGFNSDGKYRKINAETGELISENNVSVVMTEAAYNYANNTLYGISGSYLYTIDIETGASTPVGHLGNSIMAFGINYEGKAYGISLGTQSTLVSIDLNTASCTNIGNTGLPSAFIQCGGFNHYDNKFYWFQCSAIDDMNLYNVDIYTGNVTLVAANTGEVTSFFVPFTLPTNDDDDVVIYPFQGDNESEIVWSNPVDKNMTTTIEVNVEANTDDSLAGTLVKFVNVNELSNSYEIVLDETASYTSTEFRKGIYEVTIYNKHFSSDVENVVMEIWEPTVINAMLTEIVEIEDLYVSPTGWAMWDETGDPNDGDEFFFDFEDGNMDGWVLIDADGDGYNWMNPSNYASSQSYMIGQGALHPDNYMVTENRYEIEPNTKFTFMVCSGNSVFSTEHYGIAISTVSNNDLSTFTTIWEETLTAKDGAKGTRDSKAQGTWYEKTIDLSAYVGQSVYIAFRHFNSSDNFSVDIDNVRFTNNEENNTRALLGHTVMLDGEVVAENVMVPYYQHENIVEGQTYTTTVISHFTTGTSDPESYTWIAGDCGDHDGALDFTAEYVGGSAILNWTAPTSESSDEWMYYDGGTSNNGIGGAAEFYWAIKLRAADLAEIAPTELTKVALFDRVETSGTFFIYLGGDNAPEELVHTQEYVCTKSYEYAEFELPSYITIDGTRNVWVVFGTQDGMNYPASAGNDCGDPDARWFSGDRVNWSDVSGMGLSLSWSIHACFNDINVKQEPLGAFLFRDGELISDGYLPIEGSYTEEVLSGNEYEYCLRYVYDSFNSNEHHLMSCPQCVTLDAAIDCDAPEDLFAIVGKNENGEEGVNLVWPYYIPVNEWLYYDNGSAISSMGAGGNIYWAIMFPSDALQSYAGTNVTKLMVFDYEAGAATASVYFGGDNAPQTLVHTQEFEFTGAQEWIELDVADMVAVDATENLWIVIHQAGATYPAAVCNTTGDPNGRWVSVNGTEWSDLATLGNFPYTWMLRAFVTNEDGSKSRVLEHYNIYRSETNGNYELIAETTENEYFDVLEEDGTYYYQVTAFYAENGEECESEPANAFEDETQDYVVVDFVSVDENSISNMTIYPNPTKGDLNIFVENMSRIVITNALGQVLYDQDVDSDNEVIDMNQYESGVYMLHITSENGIVTERVTVIR